MFYHVQNSNFIFASEIKAILKFPDVKASISEFGIASIFLKGVISIKEKPFFKDIQSLGAGEYLIYKPGKIRIEQYTGFFIDEVKSPVIKTVDSNISLTYDEIKNIVLNKDIPSRIGEDAMMIKECERVGSYFNMNSLITDNTKWKAKYEFRRQLLSPHLRIDLDEFYHFQIKKEINKNDLCSVDRIAERFGYTILLPRINYILDENIMMSILKRIIECNDSPILELVNQDVAKKIIDMLDIDTIGYLIEMNIWLQEYHIQIR